MSPAWSIVRDVRAGALALRAAAGKYLPKFPAEHADSYADRLASATLFNAYARTVAGLTGMVFKKNPTFSTDVPAQIIEHAENIDLAGTHFDLFTKQVFEDAFEGHAFVLVDMQAPLGKGATLADELRAGRRPYWVKYQASQAVNFRSVNLNGRLEIGQITFEEKTILPDGDYGEREALRYRTFRLEADDAGAVAVTWQLQEKRVDPVTQKVTFDEIGAGIVPGFTRIPVAVVYGKKTGFLTSQPVLLDLALLNVSYYQKKSDRDRSLHLCGNPVPVFSGVPEEWQMVIAGSGFGIKLPTDAKAEYMEPQGVALEESREDLKELRGEMAALGLSTLASTPTAAQTATETVIDFTQESSELETMARSAQDCFEMCMQFHAQYLNIKDGGSLSLGSHLKAMRLNAQQVQAYSQMAANNQLSIETLWGILQSSDALPDDFDAKTEMARLVAQRAALPPVVPPIAPTTQPQAGA
jgi:hypothetical protein